MLAEHRHTAAPLCRLDANLQQHPRQQKQKQ
jgi:hypothetical protein